MRHAASLALMILTLLTGVALGHARGQVMAGGTVILCTGAAIRVAVMPGAEGVPAPDHAAVCPDMALGLMAGLMASAPLIAAPHASARRQADLPRARHVASPALAPPRARAPPSAVA